MARQLQNWTTSHQQKQEKTMAQQQNSDTKKSSMNKPEGQSTKSGSQRDLQQPQPKRSIDSDSDLDEDIDSSDSAQRDRKFQQDSAKSVQK